MKLIEATCTWGYGFDVLLNCTQKGELRQYDLTAEEAKSLIRQLEIAIQQVNELESICSQHDLMGK